MTVFSSDLEQSAVVSIHMLPPEGHQILKKMFVDPVAVFSGELDHPEGAGSASGSEERSAWLQHPR